MASIPDLPPVPAGQIPGALARELERVPVDLGRLVVAAGIGPAVPQGQSDDPMDRIAAVLWDGYAGRWRARARFTNTYGWGLTWQEAVASVTAGAAITPTGSSANSFCPLPPKPMPKLPPAIPAIPKLKLPSTTR